MKLMLTSCGLETARLLREFLSLLPCAPQEARALFIPTAAIFCDAIEVLPKFLEDLSLAGIQKENITVHDLHIPLTEGDLSGFDSIYIPGGDTAYLVKRIAEGSAGALLSYLNKGSGVILGVSAGAVVFSAHVQAGLDLLPNELHVHCAVGSADGALPEAGTPVYLTNEQGILYRSGEAPPIIS